MGMRGRGGASQQGRGESAMSAIRPQTVEVETSLRLVAPDATALAVRASLRYDPADPYAVHVLFHAETASGETVSWLPAPIPGMCSPPLAGHRSG